MNCREKDLYWQDVHLDCEESDIMPIIYSRMVEPFLEDIEQGWLAESANATGTEDRIKNYLSHVASLMIRRPEDFGIKSERAMRKIQAREVPVDSTVITGTPIERPLRVRKKPQKRETQYDKITRIKREHPDATFIWASVDVNGDFECDGRRYRVVDKRYAGRRAKGFSGTYYDFDKVWVVRYTEAGKTVIRFYSQRVDEISQAKILFGAGKDQVTDGGNT